MKTSLCTLYEGDYHYGVASLLNSLIRSGFVGEFFIGHRGPIPTWAKGGSMDRFYTLKPNAGMFVYFVPIESVRHFAYIKPDFMLQVANELAQDADNIAYIDPDITVMLSWDLLQEWLSSGVTCCADIKPWMPPMHPLRLRWSSMLNSLGEKTRNELFFYFNSGFLGVRRRDLETLVLWKKMIDCISKITGGIDVLYAPGGRSNPCFIPDQDAFNMMLMATQSPVAWVGPDGMNFEMRAGGFIFNHAVNQVKPWRRKYLTDALRGRCVSPADTGFWSNLDGPFKPYSAGALSLAKFKLRIAETWQRFRGVPKHQ
jgi:hypothetical protein